MSFSTQNKDDKADRDDVGGFAGRSSLFGADPYLQQVKKRMSREYHEDDRFEADQSARVVKDRVGEERKSSFRAEMVYSADITSVLEMFSRKLRQDPDSIEYNHEFFHACIDRIDLLLTEKNSPVQKSQVLAILSQMAYFRPKKYQRESKVNEAYGDIPKSKREGQVSERHEELIRKNSDKFMSVPHHVGRFVFQNLTKLYVKGIAGDYDDNNEDKLKAGMYEVTAIYIQMYENIERRVLDMINANTLTPKQALDIMCSYAIAEEGTNTLYVGLVQLLAERDPHQEPYTIIEIEMTLNYFPHAVWQDITDRAGAQNENNQSIGSMRERFYGPIIQQTIMYLDVLKNSQFVAIYQGLCLCGPQNFKSDHLNALLNSFVHRLQNQSNEKITFDQVISSFEMSFSYQNSLKHSMTENSGNIPEKNDDSESSLVDFEQLVTIANERYFGEFLEGKPNVYQLSCLYWIFANMDYWDASILDKMESHLCSLINKEIAIQKKLERQRDELTDASLQTIRITDLLTITKIYENLDNLKQVSNQREEVLRLMTEAQHWDKKEIDRKWFHF